jgi:hypothetical protein
MLLHGCASWPLDGSYTLHHAIVNRKKPSSKQMRVAVPDIDVLTLLLLLM